MCCARCWAQTEQACSAATVQLYTLLHLCPRDHLIDCSSGQPRRLGLALCMTSALVFTLQRHYCHTAASRTHRGRGPGMPTHAHTHLCFCCALADQPCVAAGCLARHQAHSHSRQAHRAERLRATNEECTTSSRIHILKGKQTPCADRLAATVTHCMLTLQAHSPAATRRQARMRCSSSSRTSLRSRRTMSSWPFTSRCLLSPALCC